MGIRRELASALRKMDAEKVRIDPEAQGLFANDIRIQIIQTGIFASALRVVEFFKPEEGDGMDAGALTHGLSSRAYEAASNRKLKVELEPLMSGPLAVIAFPAVSPQYLKTVLSILSPSPEFPAPRRKVNPDYHDPLVQAGLQKLMLLGARVEGKVFDLEGTRWVGGIDGGIDGLRAQLVAMLQGVGANLTNTLGSASKSLYFTMEGRRLDMEEKENPKPIVEEQKEETPA
jgi:large subunit ribosomal protein L10